MAPNQRLRPDAEEAVRTEAERSGRSQQDVIRDAIDRQLGLTPAAATTDGFDTLVASGAVRRPRRPFQRTAQRIPLPPGATTIDLIGREERVKHDRLRR
ncbi:MAG: hypothetical protein M3431_11540 [Actinomycetota bacterium]|nr:hypothetical protein [Actinomycetota bacterium]